MTLRTLLLLSALAPLALAAAPKALVVDTDHSKVEIAVKATVDSFQGQLERYTAAVAIDPENNQVSSASFSFKFADVKTGNKGRDEEMNKWQGTAAHPTVTFRLVKIDGDKTRTAHGLLTLHDVEKPVDFPVSVAADRGLYSIDGETVVDTTAFGLPVIRKFMVLKVDPKVTVRFHLQGRLTE